MNNTQEITEFDLSLLPGWGEELKCESQHGADEWDSSAEFCSKRVVARKYMDCDKRSFFICLNSYVWNVRAIEDEDSYCDGCERVVRDCWKVTPV